MRMHCVQQGFRSEIGAGDTHFDIRGNAEFPGGRSDGIQVST